MKKKIFYSTMVAVTVLLVTAFTMFHNKAQACPYSGAIVFYGKVTGAGTPIANCSVTVKIGGTTYANTTTDANGDYHVGFTGLTGTHTYTITAGGCNIYGWINTSITRPGDPDYYQCTPGCNIALNSGVCNE